MCSGQLGFLYVSVKPRLYLWEAVAVTGRKAAVVAALTLLPRNSLFVPLLVFAVLMLSLLAQLYFMPYRRVADNRLDAGLLTLATMTCRPPPPTRFTASRPTHTPTQPLRRLRCDYLPL